MNNSSDRKNKKRGGNNSGYGGNNSAHSRNRSGCGGNNWHNRKGSTKTRQNNQRSKGGERHFQKFVDTEHMNHESNYWPQNNRNCDNSRPNDYHFNEPAFGGGIHPWIRNKPSNHLIIPQHINFDEQHELNQQNEPESIVTNQEPLRVINREISIPQNNNKTEVNKPSSEVNQPAASLVTSNTPVKIKQEKDLIISLKQEKKSSSSSSSSSESSSSEDEPQNNIKAAETAKPETTLIAPLSSSPLNIKLEPRPSLVSSNSFKTTEKCKSSLENSSSSSSSSDEEPPPPPVTPKAKRKEKSQTTQISKSKNQKINSEDDVVCVGNLDNKIVLEDESENNSSTDEEPRNEITAAKVINEASKKSSEKCMICDKRGHTSFQCQMICKNCSAPYHGYRTCPHPTNLNTMMQLFIEFCMQQLQKFQVEKQNSASDCNNVPKPKVDSPHLSTANKSNKLKRKQVRANETNKKHRKSKKRKVSTSKKTKSKANNEESSDGSSEDDSDIETSATGSDEQISDSSAESLVSSKKKRKLKNANAPKPTLDLSSISANSVGLPMVLNGFPHLTAPTSSIQSQNPSTSALNTLLLTQMFQNVIGSLKQ